MCTRQNKHYCLLYHSTNSYVAFCRVFCQQFVAKMALSCLSICVDIFKSVVADVSSGLIFQVFVSVEPTECKHTNPSSLLTMKIRSEPRAGTLWEHFVLFLCERCCLITLELKKAVSLDTDLIMARGLSYFFP